MGTSVGGELNDAHGAAAAGGLFACTKRQDMLARTEVRGEHDSAGVMQAYAEAVIKIRLSEGPTIYATLDDARVGPGKNVGTDCCAREFQG